MTGVIASALAIDYDKEVHILAYDRNGYDVSFRLKKEDYTTVRTILKNGVPVTELRNVITPCDIVNYLYEANPEAQNVMVDVEVQRGKRGIDANLKTAAIAVGGFATIIMAMVIFYLAVVKDPSGAANMANTAANTIAIGT